jgi:nucleoid DNA-binding protein
LPVKGLTINELVNKLGERLDVANSFARDAIDELTEIIIDEIAAGRPFTLPGVLKIRSQFVPGKPERERFHMVTGKPMIVPASQDKILVQARSLTKLQRSAPAVDSEPGKIIKKTWEEDVEIRKNRSDRLRLDQSYRDDESRRPPRRKGKASAPK